MSAVSFIAVTQPFAAVASGKYAAQQTAPAQSQPATNSVSSVTISSSALYANYAQAVTDGAVWQKQTVASFLADPTSPLAAKSADVMAHENLLGGSIGGGGQPGRKNPQRSYFLFEWRVGDGCEPGLLHKTGRHLHE